MDIQDQIYVVSAVLGTTSVCLTISMIILFIIISRLKRKVEQIENNDLLKKRGYDQYTGSGARLRKDEYIVISKPDPIQHQQHPYTNRPLSRTSSILNGAYENTGFERENSHHQGVRVLPPPPVQQDYHVRRSSSHYAASTSGYY